MNEFWDLIDRARAEAGSHASAAEVVGRTTALLSREPAHQMKRPIERHAS